MFSIQGYIMRSLDRQTVITVQAINVKDAKKIAKDKTGVDMYFKGYAE